MFRKLHIALFVCLSCTLLFLSCAKEVNQYYEPKSSLDKNIVDVLEADGRFASFVRIIDKVGLRKTLGGSAMYTCLAPDDAQVNLYLSKNGYNSIEATPDNFLRRYVNYHFINGMYYEYDVNKLYNTATSLINRSRAANFTTRTEGNTPGKRIRLFSNSFCKTNRKIILHSMERWRGIKAFLLKGLIFQSLILTRVTVLYMS
ncbi:fasciclin domain-containing protein [Niabella ginsengisoli]|uniref:Fasciclin domain-containing protein n=1 Tax=Niabella ginsengisoli TaxID=522298 RepID=A0ABS9SNB1_9BACT|nr:fasciclin domain-containing protein [Niabella ginsengisoli]MCH5599830.1 fasciclin domain-containing protein [Niabella ginsengisoli]